MRITNSLGKSLILGLAVVLMSGTLSFAKSFDYRFKLHNNTRVKIVRLRWPKKVLRNGATLISAMA